MYVCQPLSLWLSSKTQITVSGEVCPQVDFFPCSPEGKQRTEYSLMSNPPGGKSVSRRSMSELLKVK